MSSGHTATFESGFMKDRTGENYNNLTYMLQMYGSISHSS